MALASGQSVLLDFVLLLNRLSLGLFFLLAGANKILAGVATFYRGTFTPMRPPWLPEGFAYSYGHALPFVEVALGAALVVGFFGRVTAFLTALALVSYIVAIIQAGKFVSGAPGPFHPDVVFLTLALLLTILGSGSFSVDAWLGRRRTRPG